MTKSIEEQCKDYYESLPELESSEFTGETIFRIHQVAEAFIAGAKARDVKWLEVVNELRESIKHIIKNKNVHPYEYHHYTRENIISLLSTDLTKADQMLKEMGIE